MLVLTTIFIDVSNNLPKTSYMKMIDVWLLVNLILPFIVVLTHTYMDTLRVDEDKENIKSGMARKRANKLAVLRKFSLYYNPIFVLTFALIYWTAGLKHAGLI
jgi:hypothetical protein